MSTTLPKTRNARAPRTKAKAAAPEKTANRYEPARSLASKLGADIAGLKCWIDESLPHELPGRTARHQRILTLDARRCRLLAFCSRLRKAPEKTAQSSLTEGQLEDIVTACGGTYVESLPPVHQRWSTILNAVLKGEVEDLSATSSKEAWEWFRSKTADPKVTMTNRSVGVIVAGKIVFEHNGCLTAVLKGGRKDSRGYKDSVFPPDMTPMSLDDDRNTRWNKTRRSFTQEKWSAMSWDERENWVSLAYEACACGSDQKGWAK